jgi:predicted MPP superfamily phosphohydrolase
MVDFAGIASHSQKPFGTIDATPRRDAMLDRRQFFRLSAAGGVALGSVCYGFAESGAIQVERVSVHLPNLPASFNNLRIAFLTDIHHGPYLTTDGVAAMVRTAQALQPDLILLGGDYCLRETRYIAPCFDVLKGLNAPLGVFGVLGNHDYAHGEGETRRGMKAAGIQDLTNNGLWLTRGNDRLRLGGVDDLWFGRPDAKPALGDATRNDACLLVSHNPDFAETLTDPRVGLTLCGHTHGGQASIPGLANPFVPSRYGMKYAKGLVEAPTTKVYVSKGLGLTALPMRFNCPPELTLLTLRSPQA